MNQLSLNYLDCHWAKELGFLLYLQLSGLRFEGLISITKLEEDELRKMAQAEMGWFHWDIEKAQPIFLGWASWEVLYRDWHFRKITFASLKSKPSS